MNLLGGGVLVALGCWGLFTTSRTLGSRGGWDEHRRLVLVSVAFVASCFLPGAALLGERFRPWMLVPLGVCYWALIPFPCYFKWASRGWINTARRVLFFLTGAWLVAMGTGLLALDRPPG